MLPGPAALNRSLQPDQTGMEAAFGNSSLQVPGTSGQHTHSLDIFRLRLRFLPDNFIEPPELIQTRDDAVMSGLLFECFEPSPHGLQR